MAEISAGRLSDPLQITPTKCPILWWGVGERELLDKEHFSGGSWEPGCVRRGVVHSHSGSRRDLKLKPLGCVSIDITDPHPITPNILLIRWQDSALPQTVYIPAVMGRWIWHHCQNLVDQFWVHFTRNYVPMFHTHQKSFGNLAVDSIILIVDS